TKMRSHVTRVIRLLMTGDVLFARLLGSPAFVVRLPFGFAQLFVAIRGGHLVFLIGCVIHP
ncbi:MAG: hypothetical protein ACK52S_13810, partial [Pirellula sp.]